MSKLYLVRHGQASFGQANYDKLSDLGEWQCRLLGSLWARQGLKLDAVYLGTLERQRMSLEYAREAYRAHGNDFPEPVVMPEWNEYNMQALLTGRVPAQLARDPAIASLLKEIAPDGKSDFVFNKKAMNKLLAVVMDLWVEGKLAGTGLESWSDFTARVGRGIGRVMAEQASGKTVAVFTSGGAISAAVQRALRTPDKPAMQIGWVIKNASISEFRYDGTRFSMETFNTVPHLNNDEQITLR